MSTRKYAKLPNKAVVCQRANMATRSKNQSKQKAMALPTFAFGH